MRYTGSVSNAFVQSMAHNFEQALRLMEAALTDCPDDLWETDLWLEEAPTPSADRYHGMLFAAIVGSMPVHVVEHASQIRQFLTAAGVTVQPMPGDRAYIGSP